jgi:hypothetical protein
MARPNRNPSDITLYELDGTPYRFNLEVTDIDPASGHFKANVNAYRLSDGAQTLVGAEGFTGDMGRTPYPANPRGLLSDPNTSLPPSGVQSGPAQSVPQTVALATHAVNFADALSKLKAWATDYAKQNPPTKPTP